jgi:hypothetical protein
MALDAGQERVKGRACVNAHDHERITTVTSSFKTREVGCKRVYKPLFTLSSCFLPSSHFGM